MGRLSNLGMLWRTTLTLALVSAAGLLFWLRLQKVEPEPLGRVHLEAGDAPELYADSVYVDAQGVAVPSTVNDRHRDHLNLGRRHP